MQRAAHVEPIRCDIELIRLYYEASRDSTRREEFLFTLPLVFTPGSSELIEEFLVHHHETILAWLSSCGTVQSLHAARVVALRLVERAPVVMERMQTMNAAVASVFNTNIISNKTRN